MRGLFQIVAVLEGAGLALVGVDHHVARRGFGAHEAPLLEGREAGTAQAAQAGVLQHLADLLDRDPAGAHGLQQRVAALGAVGVEALPGDRRRMQVAAVEQRAHRGRRGMAEVAVADLDHRRAVAAPHARRAQHADVGRVHLGGERGLQRARAGELARQRIAHADGDRRRRNFPVAHDVEVGVEGGGLEHRGHRQVHPVRERAQVAQREVAPGVLDRMQMLDQAVARARAAGEQGFDVGERGGLELPAALRGAGFATHGGVRGGRGIGHLGGVPGWGGAR